MGPVPKMGTGGHFWGIGDVLCFILGGGQWICSPCTNSSRFLKLVILFFFSFLFFQASCMLLDILAAYDSVSQSLLSVSRT